MNVRKISRKKWQISSKKCIRYPFKAAIREKIMEFYVVQCSSGGGGSAANQSYRKPRPNRAAAAFEVGVTESGSLSPQPGGPGLPIMASVGH